MDGFVASLTPLSPVWPEAAARPRVEKISAWRWMRAVYARMHDVPGVVQVSWDHPEPDRWEGLPLAAIDLEEVDIFEPAPPLALVALGERLPYMLRVVSLPGEQLRVGDRRMVRAKPGGKAGAFEIIAGYGGFGEGQDDVLLEIGGSKHVHTVQVPGDLLSSMALDDDVSMIQIDLQGVDLDAEPGHSLGQRFNQWLGDIEEPERWFVAHMVRGSARPAQRRAQVDAKDEERFARWIQSLNARRGGGSRGRDDEDPPP